MTNEQKKMSPAKARRLSKEEKVILSYREAKASGENITEWKLDISRRLKISIHTVNHYLRPSNHAAILARIKENNVIV